MFAVVTRPRKRRENEEGIRQPSGRDNSVVISVNFLKSNHVNVFQTRFEKIDFLGSFVRVRAKESSGVPSSDVNTVPVRVFVGSIKEISNRGSTSSFMAWPYLWFP